MFNYDASATYDDGSCVAHIRGCMDPAMFNYNASANEDDNSCVAIVRGCMNSAAVNFNAEANEDDGLCRILGCSDPMMFNYNASANEDDGSCVAIVQGCMNSAATNFDSSANEDNGLCNINCVGEWSDCDANCSKVYNVVTAMAGTGSDCDVIQGSVDTCVPGEGLCVGPEYEFVIGKAGEPSCTATCALNTGYAGYENTTCVNNQEDLDWLAAEWDVTRSNVSDIIAGAKEVHIDDTILSGEDKTLWRPEPTGDIQCSDISEASRASLNYDTRLYGEGAGYPFIGTAVPPTVIMGRVVDDLENGRCYVAGSRPASVNRCELTGSVDNWPSSRRRICKCGADP